MMTTSFDCALGSWIQFDGHYEHTVTNLSRLDTKLKPETVCVCGQTVVVA